MNAAKITVPNIYDPALLDLKLLPTVDAWSGLNTYLFENPYDFEIPGRPGKFATFPKDEKTDGGSIPKFLHGIMDPMELMGRIAFVRHDLKYTVQGGRRCYISDRSATEEYSKQNITRLRADIELFVDYLTADLYFRNAAIAAEFTIWKMVVLYGPGLVWLFFKACCIFLAVRAFGGGPWNSVELETVTSQKQTP